MLDEIRSFGQNFGPSCNLTTNTQKTSGRNDKNKKKTFSSLREFGRFACLLKCHSNSYWQLFLGVSFITPKQRWDRGGVIQIDLIVVIIIMIIIITIFTHFDLFNSRWPESMYWWQLGDKNTLGRDKQGEFVQAIDSGLSVSIDILIAFPNCTLFSCNQFMNNADIYNLVTLLIEMHYNLTASRLLLP